MKKYQLIIAFLFIAGCSVNQETPQPPQEEPTQEETTEESFDFEITRTGELSAAVLINVPARGETISSPLMVTGEAPGNWFFEATAPVSIVDWNGLIVGEGYIEAQEDWMTENLVPFQGEIKYSLPEDIYRSNGWVILRRNNPSDLPENDAAVEVPIQFSQE